MNLTLPICAVFLLLMSACQPNSNGMGDWKKSPIIKIAVSNTPLSSPIFIADKKGFFKQHGLNIQLVREDGGVKCFNELMAGNVDFATTSESVVMFNSFYRSDFIVLASFVESDNDVKLLSMSSQKFNDLAAIAGAKVGIVKSSASEFFFDSLLMLYHQQDAQIQRVYLKPTQMVHALQKGEVDLISAWEPFPYQLAEESPQASQVIGTKGLYNLSFNLVGLKNNRIDTQNKQSILQALSDAINFINENPEDSQLLISEILDIDKIQLSYLWRDYAFRLSLSNALVSNLQLQSQWAIDRSLVPKDNRIDIRQILDRELFESAMNEHTDEHK
ncbi:ABC transporter substrate-binding protein [Shewanella subflava]|uniref:ABC transporter substrate-binding protein n=1 Tax=Shewanella subflava TaxID=2986476 RepID=A0ABT3I6T7_9GAMM|nr:ABC transporter substrate-binding protein [Shewanella subflava]MCW3171779.1 ABC transporter substrate-binding protein [Shewanella subflava]